MIHLLAPSKGEGKIKNDHDLEKGVNLQHPAE